LSQQHVSEVHTHLYHYTDWAALNGILKTNELWASHIRFLNDQTEYLLAQKFVESRLEPSMRKWLENTTQNDAELKKIVADLGGIEHQANDLAKSLMHAMYEVMGNDFFVASFCGTPVNEYEKENGLLSQWRGYGSQQGFLLVLETKILEAMMKPELAVPNYDMIYMADVVYSNDEEKILAEFSDDLEQLRNFVLAMVEAIAQKSSPPDVNRALFSFVRIATRLKHQAFGEEKEVRLVGAVVKHTPQLAAQAAKKGGKLPPQKLIELRQGRFGLTPFIKLFGETHMPLPIRKIIVGPSKDKFLTADALRRGLHGRHIEVAVSDIPYI
jgi:hypothetical protein